MGGLGAQVAELRNMRMGGYLTKGNPAVCLGPSGGWVSIPPAIPEESRVSAAPTALSVVVEGFPALPGWLWSFYIFSIPGMIYRASVLGFALYQGTTSVVPLTRNDQGFSPCYGNTSAEWQPGSNT